MSKTKRVHELLNGRCPDEAKNEVIGMVHTLECELQREREAAALVRQGLIESLQLSGDIVTAQADLIERLQVV